MNKSEFFIKKENIHSFSIINEIKNNNNQNNISNQKELSQMFNNLYDSNFLIIINELSSQIHSFYKSSIIHFNLINSFLLQNENKELPKISNIQNSFNSIESLFKQFYSTAKILFKKMKIYRSEKIKNIRHYSLNNENKKQTILFKKDKKSIPVPLLNFEKLKNNDNNSTIENNENGWDSARSNKTDKIIYLNNSNESNINSNSSNNNSNNNFSQSCNTTIDKESNIILIEDKNQHSNQLIIESFNNLNKEINNLEEILLSNENNKDKINNIINIIKNINKTIKENLTSSNLNIINENMDKKIINNLSNKINLLIEENTKIKKQFEKYRTDEKIKKKFFENQIFILSNKNNENEKNKKNQEKNFTEMKSKLEEITNINNNIASINTELNEELKIKTEKIAELQNIINEKINDNIKINETQSIDQINKENKTAKFNPEDYSVIKIYQINNKLKWILLKKNLKHIINFKKNQSNSKNKININNISNNSNKEINDDNYNDYIWIPYKSEKDFDEFGDVSLFIEKEKDFDNIIMKLNQKNKIYENEIEKLKIENYNLNNIIYKYKTEIKEDKNFVGISFIEEDPECSKFIDDKGCEEILTGLDKNKDNINKYMESIYNNKIKNNIDMLITNFKFSKNVIPLFSSILKQLGYSDEDIIKIIENNNKED